MPEVQMPWDRDGEEFDADKARKYITALQGDKEKLQTRLQNANTSAKGNKDSSESLKRENVQLRVQMQTGLNDQQIRRLVGDTEEELIEDAKNYAQETGIELRSLFEDPNAGEPGQDQDGDQGANEGEQAPREGERSQNQFGRNYRTPQGQMAGDFDRGDNLDDIVATMDLY